MKEDCCDLLMTFLETRYLIQGFWILKKKKKKFNTTQRTPNYLEVLEIKTISAMGLCYKTNPRSKSTFKSRISI